MSESIADKLRRSAKDLNLDAPPYFWSLPSDILSREFNGTGPDYFPQSLRKLLDSMTDIFQEAVLIHDIDYYFSDCTFASWRLADKRIVANMRKLLSIRCPLSNPKNWIKHTRYAMRIALIDKTLSQFGLIAWISSSKERSS